MLNWQKYFQGGGGGGILHVSDGKVEARPKQTKEKVNAIEQSTDIFFIFMSIYLSRYPARHRSC